MSYYDYQIRFKYELKEIQNVQNGLSRVNETELEELFCFGTTTDDNQRGDGTPPPSSRIQIWRKLSPWSAGT